MAEIIENSFEQSTVVCVTSQLQCERLIKAGRLIADMSKTNLTVISVVKPGDAAEQNNALEYLFEVSKQNGATMSIIYSNDAFKTITDFIRDHRAMNVVTGLRQGQNSILPQLWQRFKSTNFFTVTLDGEVNAASLKDDLFMKRA